MPALTANLILTTKATNFQCMRRKQPHVQLVLMLPVAVVSVVLAKSALIVKDSAIWENTHLLKGLSACFVLLAFIVQIPHFSPISVLQDITSPIKVKIPSV